MNASAVVALGAPAPANSVGPIVCSLIDSNNVVQDHQQVDAKADATTVLFTFMNVLPGTYTVSAARTDATGTSVAPAIVSAPFTVTAPSTVTVPVSVTVSVA